MDSKDLKNVHTKDEKVAMPIRSVLKHHFKMMVLPSRMPGFHLTVFMLLCRASKGFFKKIDAAQKQF